MGNDFGTQPAFTGKFIIKAKGYNATGDIVVGDYSLYGDVEVQQLLINAVIE